MKIHFLTHAEFNGKIDNKAFSNIMATDMLIVRLHLQDPDFNPIHVEETKGDWIDLMAAESVDIPAGESRLINLGCAMKLPEGFEAHLLPRSSTFHKYGILMAISMGIIDNAYSGTEDYWKFCAYATRNTTIRRGDRIAQFRLMPNMEHMYQDGSRFPFSGIKPTLVFVLEDSLDAVNRGGFGSTDQPS